jgi:hypothetical protein
MSKDIDGENGVNEKVWLVLAMEMMKSVGPDDAVD